MKPEKISHGYINTALRRVSRGTAHEYGGESTLLYKEVPYNGVTILRRFCRTSKSLVLQIRNVGPYFILSKNREILLYRSVRNKVRIGFARSVVFVSIVVAYYSLAVLNNVDQSSGCRRNHFCDV